MEARRKLEMNCWLYGEEAGRIFKITIQRKDSNIVADLKVAIKDERSARLRDVDASDLDIYYIPSPDDEHLKETLAKWTLIGNECLSPSTKLSRCFPSDSECLIIVKAPPHGPAEPSGPVPYRTLSCWVRGQESSRIFLVNIPRDATVDALRKAIKDEKQVDFRGIDANTLKLYVTPYPGDENAEDTLARWSPEGQSYLNARKKVNFSDKLIVVCPPILAGQPTVDLGTKFTCWVHGEATNVLFSVRVSMNDTVEEVQKAVKEERPDIFDSIPAAKIKLFRARNLNVEELEEFAEGIASEKVLLAVQKLSDTFSQHLEGRIHVIVGDPSRDGRTTSGEVEEERDVLAALAQTFRRTTRISKSLTPSKVAKSNEYAKIQAGSRRVLDCRFSADEPVDTVAPPIQLFNPAFAFFSSKAFDPTYIVPADFHREIRQLMTEFAPIYGKEKTRREKIRPFVSKATQRVLSSIVNSDKTSPDFVVQGSNNVLPTYLVVVEEKNEFGDGGSDPSVQAGFSYLRLISQPENKESCRRSCCPAFIIAHAGPWLSIMGGIVVDRCIVQRLTDYVWVPLHSTHDDTQSLRIARILFALRQSITLLDLWYQQLDTAVAPYDCTPVFHPRFWPSPTAYTERSTNTHVEFTYQRPLENDIACVTYLAKTHEDNPKDVVVKFVTSYGAEAHEHMAMKGFAPRILYHGEINVSPDMPSYGHLRMVVMEYVKGWTLHDAVKLPSERIPSSFESDLHRAFRHLHDGGYVFGDLRMPNIMVRVLPEGTPESTVQLIDFDWAGKEGEAKYPISINSSTIAWPQGVEELACIERRHDEVMLKSLLLDVPNVVATRADVTVDE